MSNLNLPQNIGANNNAPFAQPGQLVTLTRTMVTLTTGRILPAGTVGRVIMYKPAVNKLMIDFGISNYAQGVDPLSGDIELVRG